MADQTNTNAAEATSKAKDSDNISLATTLKAKDSDSASLATTLVPEEDTKKLAQLPSHSTLAMANYPHWSELKKLNSPPKDNNTQSGASASTVQAILRTDSSDGRKSKWKLDEEDPNNRHKHRQKREGPYNTRPEFNYFGVGLGGLGKAPWSGYRPFKKSK